MTHETKVGLLVGMAVIMLIAILVDDFLAEVKRPATDMVHFPVHAGDLDHAQAYPPQGLPGEQGAAHDRGPIPAQAFEHQSPSRRQGVILPQQPMPARQAPPANTRQRNRIDPDKNHYPPRAVARHEAPQIEELTLDDVIEQLPRRSRTTENILTFDPSDRRTPPSSAQTDNRRSILPSVEEAERSVVATADTTDRRSAPPPPDLNRSSRRVATDIEEKTWHTVETGETLYHVAKRFYDDGEKWREIVKANPNRVSPDGGVQAGVRLIIPNLKEKDAPRLADRQPDRDRIETVRTTEELEQRLRARQQPTAPASGVWITVERNQSLSELARIHLGKETLWPRLRDANRDILRDGETVYAGMKLRLPATGAARTADKTRREEQFVTAQRETNQRVYVVKPGENLSTIAAKTLGDRNKYMVIFNANKDRLEDENDITAGQELVIPTGSVN